MGIPRSWARRTTAATSWVVFGQDDGVGDAALDGGVVLEDDEVFGGEEDVIVAGDGLEFADDVGREHGYSVAGNVRVVPAAGAAEQVRSSCRQVSPCRSGGSSGRL